MTAAERSSPLFEPDGFRFSPGEKVTLKDWEILERIHDSFTREILSGLEVDWCPPKGILRDLVGKELTVQIQVSYHGGIPLYFLSYNGIDGEITIRLCDSFLTSVTE